MRLAPLPFAMLLVASPALAQTPPAGAAPQVTQAPMGPPAAPSQNGGSAPKPQAEPSSGTVLLVLGGLGLVSGAAEFAFLPLCYAGRVPTTQRPACVGVAVAAGAALIGAGIGLTVVGAQRRAAWLTWTQGARVGVLPGGAFAGWSGSW